MNKSCARGDIDWILENISSLEKLSSIDTGCPGKCLSHQAWRYLKYVQVLCLRTGFSGALDSFMVGLSDLKGIFQTK